MRALGEEFPVEHGFHGFFAQYYNLRGLLDAAAVAPPTLAPSPGYPVLFADRPAETFGRTTRLFPFNMLSVVRQSHALRLGDFRHDGDGLTELMRFDGERTFARFDGIDFARFAIDGRINRPMVETVLEPFGKTTLNRVERLSAAEAIRFFHFYFMGNPEGLGFSYLVRDSVTAIVEPLRRRLESLGGRVVVGKGARRLVLDGGRVARVVVDARPAPEPRADAGARRRAGDRMARPAPARRLEHLRAPARRRASRRSTAAARTWAARSRSTTRGGFRCPCHGGRFDGDGKPARRPAQGRRWPHSRPAATAIASSSGTCLTK